MRVNQKIYFIALPLTLLLSGCALTNFLGLTSDKTAEAPGPAGIYKSVDRGDTWLSANAVLTTSSRKLTLDKVNVLRLLVDPTDRQTFYLGSEKNGLFYSYDSAKQWWQSGPIRSGAVNDIAVPNDATLRCTLYLATANRILKSNDCGRFWDQQYYDTRLKEKVLSLHVNRDNSNIILAGLSTGDIMRSMDAGVSWETMARLPGPVERFQIHHLDANIVYAIITKKGLWKTTDGGVNWDDLNEGLKEFAGARGITDIAVDPGRPETIILSSSYGLVRSTDGGVTWTAIDLLTPPRKVVISAVALNPKDPSELYYTTDTTLYRSNDAGETWETRPLPISGVKTRLIVDSKLTDNLYLGVYKKSKK